MYRSISKKSFKSQLIFTLLIAFSVIAFWRGVWGLLDIYLLPKEPIKSFIVSLVIGILILTLTGYTAKELT